jgi:NADH:ubiquinone oxidoreductase subunit E
MPSAAPEVAHNVLEAHERLLIDQAITKCGNRPGALLGILEAVQLANAHKFLSMDALRYIADETGVPPARVYSAATFY